MGLHYVEHSFFYGQPELIREKVEMSLSTGELLNWLTQAYLLIIYLGGKYIL